VRIIRPGSSFPSSRGSRITSVHYKLDDGIATIRIDDGKRNALSPDILREIYASLDRAADDRAVVIITGRDDVFSAGFDLNVMKRGGIDALRMLRLGFSLTARVMSHPCPVVAACNGHALAMGVFLMLSADHVIGTRGDYKIAANEVAIGMILPRVAAAMLQHRLAPSAYQRAAVLSQYFSVDAALDAGFFDELVDPGELHTRAGQRARDFRKLDMHAHRVTKRRIRRSLVRKIKWSVPLDLLSAMLTGLRRTRSRGATGSPGDSGTS